MKRHPLMCLALFMGLLLFINMAAAQDMLPKGKWWKHPEVLENIDLSDEQIQKIEAISNESMRRIIQLEADSKIARLDLEALLDQVDQQKLDLDAVEKQIDLVNRIRGELSKERIMMLARIRNLLPKEAINQLKRLRGRFRGGPEGKRGRMGKGEWLDKPPGPGSE
jgi:Spy/CpxP family protein refolding chaperone